MPVSYPQLDEAALGVLREAIKATGSIAAVARRLGYSRPALSSLLSGSYPADTRQLRALIMETFGGRLRCPHLAEEIAAADCAWHRSRPIPTSRRSEVEHWLACKTCSLNPDRKDPAPCSASSNSSAL